uniref:hypothetical protein n=1 Tax=Paracoccus sp. SSK6 TaxID=3143131 RepID=UPI00321B2A40
DAVHHDDYQEARSIIDQPARDSLWWLIDTLGVAKAKEIAEAMNRATGRNFGAEMFKEVWFSYDHGREPAAA